MNEKELNEFLDKQIEYHEYWINVCQQTGNATASNTVYLEHQIRFQTLSELKKMVEPKQSVIPTM